MYAIILLSKERHANIHTSPPNPNWIHRTCLPKNFWSKQNYGGKIKVVMNKKKKPSKDQDAVVDFICK